MRDRDMVTAIVAGDPEGLAAAYDSYASSLHAYCRTLLADPADAADAVQDTFVIAAAKLGALRDPDRLRPWLYAVARNECHRRLRGRARQAGLDEAGDMTDLSADVSEEAERGELRGLVLAAIGGLNPGDREVIELNLRHDLDGADLADALGVPANQAHALASRARTQLERSLGALLVARTGREQCAELDQILAGWGGELTVLLRKRVSRHIENCETCGACKRRELSPAALFSVLPVIMLPAGLRQQMLRLVSDASADGAAYRARVAHRAEPFGPDGFPVQLSPMQAAGRASRTGFRLLAAAAVLLVLCGAAYLLLHASWRGQAGEAAATSSIVASVPPSSTAPLTSAPAPATSKPATSAPATTAPASPAPSLSSTAPARPSPSPSRTRSASPSPTPTPTPTPGTLSASPTTIRLVQSPGGSYTGSFVLTASGGPVRYSVTAPTGPNGEVYLSPSPASGTLKAGQSLTIVITAVNGGPPTFYNTVTVDPGGLAITVYYPPSG